MAVRNEGQLGDGAPSVAREEFGHEGGIAGESLRHGTVETDRECTDERIHGQVHAEGECLILR